MRLQLRAVSLFLTLASTVLASSSVSSTEGVAGAIVGTLGGIDGRQSADNGPVPLRRSITELAAEAGPQWHLYLQALRAMYDRDSKDPESFFQIAGELPKSAQSIHGRPFTEYNNAGKMNTNGWSGYSTHGEILFIIWHRPFVALFEQTLVKEAKILAAQYPDNLRPIYQRAAEDLRAPYWDWALEPWLPSVVLPETIEVKAATKTGTVAKKIDNPLYTYRFSKEVMQGKYGEFNTYNRMYRCQNPQDANQKLYSRNYKSWVYDVFSRAKSFSEFATTASKGSSLEGVHNAIHWDAGCGGQFMDSQYSAFEPLFMLHHSNVDRLWAYWQAIYPEASTFNGRYQGLSRFNTLSGTMIGLDSPLQPFRQAANGDWHTSRSVNSIKTFGYTYQGLEEYWNKSETEVQQRVVELINSLYGPEEKQRPSVSSTSAKSTQTSSKQSIQTTSTESTQTTLTQSNHTTLTQSTQTISSKQSTQSVGEQSTQPASQQSTPTTINKQSSQTTSTESTETTIKQSSQTGSTQSTQSISSKQSTQSVGEQSSQPARKQSTQSSAQASSQPAPTISTSTSSSQSTETINKQSTPVSVTVSTGTSNQQSKETSSIQSTTQSSGTVSTEMDNQHSIETSSVQSTQSHTEKTSSSVLSPPLQSAEAAGNRTTSAWPTAGASKPSPISSSSRAGNETSVASSATSAALPTTSSQVDAHSDANATETGDHKRFYAGITVDVAYLPVRPCAIEISIDMWRAGDMAIMQMPEKGIVYDSISLSDAIANAGLGDVADDEVLSQVMSRLHVVLRKADGSSIDVTQISGLRVDIEEAEVVTATSKFELPQMVKSSTHVMLDKPVSGCAAQYY
ncbi:tyrosinase 2 [Beauveria brongniartii RCEF 3172]|uniref:Tyrosinase 2 n=1 Tax=Beauveria brongniartii RCEF 3172 TaxID=1081107 RepID=A0A167B106_9HYPO|nr:tyrosinase 2 [Beauveria brongniartii RCEF 3172]